MLVVIVLRFAVCTTTMKDNNQTELNNLLNKSNVVLYLIKDSDNVAK